MKGAIYLALLLLLVTSAYALTTYGGDTFTYIIDKCDKLHISIQPSDLTEWNVSECNETVAGEFECECYTNRSVHLTPAINSVGTFNITINITGGVYYECPTCRSGGGGGGTRTVYINNTRNITKIVNQTVEVIKEVPTPDGGSCTAQPVIPNEPSCPIPEPVEKPSFPWWLVAICGGLFLLFLILLILYLRERRKRKEEERKRNEENTASVPPTVGQ